VAGGHRHHQVDRLVDRGRVEVEAVQVVEDRGRRPAVDRRVQAVEDLVGDSAMLSRSSLDLTAGAGDKLRHAPTR
jgi:hypothetical protein